MLQHQTSACHYIADFAHLTSRAETFDDNSDELDSLHFGLLWKQVRRQDIYKVHL